MIKVFKTVNNEEIIADVRLPTDPSEEGFYLMKEPVVLVIQPNGTGGVGIGLAPYMPYANKITLSFSSIVSEGEPEENLKAEYLKHFGEKSPIVLAPANFLKG